jgi:HlyD family secretion protein
VIAAGVFWQLQQSTGFGGGGGGAVTSVLPSVATEEANLVQTIRLTGTTKAEKFVSITSPRIRGSRSRRGASASGTVGVKSNVTVRSTTSVTNSSSMNSLSQTGTVSSSSGAASRGGGTGGGGGGPSSSAFQAATSRTGGGGSGGSGGNIIAAGAGGAGAMGARGIGSTTPRGGGGGGGGRRRGDFHLQLQTLAESGVLVKKGEVIAEFDRQYMATRLQDYVTSVIQHEANLEKSRADAKVTRETHNQKVRSAKDSVERAELDVKTIPVLSAIQAERTKLALEEAKAEYEQLLTEVKFQRISEEAQLREEELEVKEAQIELKRTETGVDRLVVKAPLDGMVVRLSVFRNGEMNLVKEGDELWSGMPFLQVVDTSSMLVEAKVNQVDAEKLRIGQKARVRFDAFPDLDLPASVHSIGTVAKSRQYRKEFITEIPVLLKLERTEGRVIPDLSVSADVVLETEEEATQVPIAAVHYDGSSGRPYVYVKTAAGWERRDVELGLQNNIKVAIRSGLQSGDEVALEPPPAANTD